MAFESQSYNDVPYHGLIHFQSHVDTLATIATLFGMDVAPPTSCRVLEVGCADGSNLITMAFHLPGSTFIGIDGSAPQIERGKG
ncbi:MAG: tRNA G46 methylase TrmB, partial [Myxococcota bacterium]